MHFPSQHLCWGCECCILKWGYRQEAVPSPLSSLAASGPAGHGHSLLLFLQATLAESCSPNAEQEPDFEGTQADLCKWMVTMQCSVNRLFVNRKICCFEEIWYFFRFFFFFFPIFLFNFLWKNEIKTLKKIFAFLNSYFYVATSETDEKSGAESMERECPNHCFTTFCRKYLENVKMLYLCQHFSLKDSYILTSWAFVLSSLLCGFRQDFQLSRIQKAIMSTSL